jgi:hypothetical protein
MALFKPGIAVAAVSGSIGGTVFSHNRGGMYIRNRSIPTNPQTEKQIAIRTILSQQSALWRSASPSQQAAWTSWAAQHPVTNALGEKTTLSGQMAFVQLRHRLVQAGDTVIAVPGISTAPSALLTLTAVASVATQACAISYTATPIGANERLWIMGCVVDSAGITNVNNLYRLIAISAKNQATGLNIGDEITTIFGPFVLYQNIHLRISVFDSASGLLSQPKPYLEVVGA